MDGMVSTNGDTTEVSTVFVVDDDDGVRTSLGILLESAGYHPATFGSAAEFLEQHDPARPGCLLLDMRMPLMSGMELLQTLSERGAFLPVIFITGHGDVPMAVESASTNCWNAWAGHSRPTGRHGRPCC